MMDRFEISNLLSRAATAKVRGVSRNPDGGFVTVERDGIKVSSTTRPVVASIQIVRDPDDYALGWFTVWNNGGEIADGPWVRHVEKILADIAAETETAQAASDAREREELADRSAREAAITAAMSVKWAAKPLPAIKE